MNLKKNYTYYIFYFISVMQSQASRPEQSVMQALESLTETQVRIYVCLCMCVSDEPKSRVIKQSWNPAT